MIGWIIKLFLYKKNIILFLIIIILDSNLFPQELRSKINGFVKDAKTNERLIGAVILSDGAGTALSDSSGFFNFYCKAGKHKIECRYIGYETSSKEINISKEGDEIDLFFYLKPVPIQLEKVSITGKRYKELSEYKTYELKSGEITNIPVLLEPDALRPLQALPGVIVIHDLSSLIYLRGGNFDETLITLDDVPVYNSYHLGGIFGSFNPDILDSEILYPSNYPINYQGALSGVLSIHSKSGNNERLKGIASAGLVSSKIFLEGPLSKGSFIFSARRTYPDLLLNLLSKGSFPYYFYDFNGKYTIHLDDKNLISFSGFYSKDIFKLFVDEKAYIIEKKDDINWGNRIAHAAYNHLFNTGTVKLYAYYSNSFFQGNAKGISRVYNYVTIQDSLNSIEHIFIDNNIKDFTLKSEVEFNITGQEIRSGVEYKNLSVNYNWDIKEKEISSTINGSLKDVFFDFAPDKYYSNDYTNILSAYISDKLQISSSFDLLLGYRGLLIKKIDKYLSSPYILADFKLNDKIKLSASYGKYYEYFFTKSELTNTTFFSPFAVYFIIDNIEHIPSSDHFSLGLKVNEIIPGIRFDAEGYYKTRYNIITSDELTETISYTNGYSTGLDILLKKDEGTLTGWAAYSLSKTVKNNNGYWYYADYDRTHNFKLMLSYGLSENWEINSFWIYSTGMPFTPAVGKYIIDNINGQIELAFGKKNTYRFEDYHRLDIGITGSFIWGMFVAKPYLQVMNVYNSKNPFNYKPSAFNTTVEEGTERGSMIIPTIGLTLEF